LRSVSILLGWSFSSLLYLSTTSRAALSRLSCICSMLVSFSQAAVGVDLVSMLKRRRAWFCIVSNVISFVLLAFVCRGGQYFRTDLIYPMYNCLNVFFLAPYDVLFNNVEPF
jgi:hypothetical protein